MASSGSAPFVVITLRRTGGTSLMTFMSRVSEYETVQHEPFNVDRIWGSIVADFLHSKDEKSLKRSVQEVLANRPNIKHCVEIIPLEVTRVLIEECRNIGYTFFVLTRRNEVDRLMSLMLAHATGVWGGNEAKEIYPKIISGEKDVPALSVDDAIVQARRDSSYLGDILKLLRHRRIEYDWLVFEEIYKGERPLEDYARCIARKLGTSIGSSDPRLLELGEGSAQNSGRIEARVRNADLVRRRLEQVCLE